MGPERVVNNDEFDKVFFRNRDVVTRKIAGELFLVPLRGKIADMERIFTLTAVAERIWNGLDGQRKLNEILNDIVDSFDVEPERAASDVREFIAELLAAGLITGESI